MKIALLPVYIVAGFLVLLIALPQSRWIPLTQADVVTGQWRYRGGMFTEISTYVNPLERGLGVDDTPPDETAALLRLISPPGNLDIEQSDRRYADLLAICQEKNSPVLWAQYVRVASVSTLSDLSKSPHDKFAVRQRKNCETLVNACLSGEKVDPDNAFFPLIRASALRKLERDDEGRDALRLAARKPRYESYIRFEPDTRYKWLVDRYGYRGQELRGWIYANVLLPHLSAIRSGARHFVKIGKDADRVAAAQIGMLLMRQDSTLIGVMVGRVLFLNALAPEIEPQSDPHLTDDEILTRATALEKATPGDQGLTEGAKAAIALSKDGAIDWPNEDGLSLIMNMNAAYSGGAFLALLLLIPAMGMLWLKARFPRFAAAAPYLAWFPAFMLSHLFGGDFEAVSYFGFVSALFVPALFPKIRRYVDILGLALTAFALYRSLEAISLFAVCGVFLYSLWNTRRASGQANVFVTAFGVIAMSLVASAVWTALALRFGFNDAVFFGSLVALSALATVPSPRNGAWGPVAGIACLALGGLYGYRVALDVQADRKLEILANEILNEAERVRKESGAFAG